MTFFLIRGSTRKGRDSNFRAASQHADQDDRADESCWISHRQWTPGKWLFPPEEALSALLGSEDIPPPLASSVPILIDVVS